MVDQTCTSGQAVTRTDGDGDDHAVAGGRLALVLGTASSKAARTEVASA